MSADTSDRTGAPTIARMRLNNVRRVGVLAWPIAVGALVLASCGSDGAGGATASTLNLDTEATNYIVKDPVTTTIAPLIDETDTTGEQIYIVQAGDYAIKVADLFQVPLEDLLNYNGWASGAEFPFPGQEVRIPPGGAAAGAPANDTPTEEPAAAETPVGETIPEAGSNCEAGSYTIEAGDTSRVKVANKFDVTVEAMDAANAGTDGYSSFYPGLEIVIPAKADC